jgi:TonB family protein
MNQPKSYRAIFYGFYYAFLRKETFFKPNRIYLISSLFAGLIIPQLQLTTGQPDVIFVQTVQLSVQTISAQVESTAMTLPSLQEIFWGIYLLGIIILAIRLMADMFKIWRLKKNGLIIENNEYQLVISNELHPPFSFFNYLFIAKEDLEKPADSEKIIAHELAHIRGKHSFDVLLSEVFCVLFWFNPLVHLYKKSLQDVHEFLADSEVTRHTSIKKYGHLLLRQAVPSAYLSLSNHFNHSQLKKRIQMMTKKKSSKWAFSKYALALPMIALMAILFSAYDYPTVLNKTAEQISSINNGVTTVPNNDSIYRKVDEAPRFQGCDEGTADEKEACSNGKLLGYIGKNLKYPAEAKNEKTQGMVVLSFVIGKDGKVKDAKVIKKVSVACDEAALAIIHKMQEEITWVPGIKDGKAVNVEMLLPIKFALK